MRFWITGARAEGFGGAKSLLLDTGTVSRLLLGQIGLEGDDSAGRQCYRVVYFRL